jgi:Rod binding domain-containing protein
MNIPSLNPSVKAADLSLEKLATSTTVKDSEKVQELSRQFEAVLLRQILTEAQKESFGPHKSDSSSSKSIYQDMITNQLADGISRSGAFGLGTSLAPQLSRELKQAQKEADALAGTDGDEDEAKKL